ncbi:hypothetical protein FH972_005666 [Carpinus fangiana]|uniref:Uncharacterized protein n=1 Tax=Carpinus fangiana TaxID=176857 RepID=A0A5N6QPY3_9ROSI|nr:hypothetical protein FH972_005666 [Carpinus fangiana]
MALAVVTGVYIAPLLTTTPRHEAACLGQRGRVGHVAPPPCSREATMLEFNDSTTGFLDRVVLCQACRTWSSGRKLVGLLWRHGVLHDDLQGCLVAASKAWALAEFKLVVSCLLE